jgi:SAM-dependent methyltransferase
VVECLGCGLAFTLLNDDADVPANNESYYDLEKWGPTYFAIQEQLKSRYYRCLGDIRKFKENGKLLDVGCSLGFFLDAARENGFDAYGVEPVESAAAFARTTLHLNVVSGTLEQAKYPDKFFDVICLFDVLEHIPAPLDILGEVRRILKDDGLLVVQCPNLKSNMATLTGQHWRWLLLPQHLYHFTPETLTALLHRGEFTASQWQAFDDEREFVDNVAEAIVSTCGVCKPVQRVFSKLRYLVRPIIRLAFKCHYSKRQSTEGGLMLMFAHKASGNQD